MTFEILIGVFILLILSTVILIRYLELIPTLLFRLIEASQVKHGYTYRNPEEFGLKAELLETKVQDLEILIWHLPSPDNLDSAVIMVPNWYHPADHENNLITAGIIQTAGYNVFLPVFHWSIEGQVYQKHKYSPKTYRIIIEALYDYVSEMENIDIRKIGIWSNESGAYQACQLTKNYPIKAIILEDGPVSLTEILYNLLCERGAYLPKVFIRFALFPFVWRSRWQPKNCIKNIRTCPSFLMINRENCNSNALKKFNNLYKPKQLWFEHAFLPKGGIKQNWFQEYSIQIHTFYDKWIHELQKPELDYELSKKKVKGKYQCQIRISAIPPQMDTIPLQILLGSKKGKLHEVRLWFTGAVIRFNQELDFNPIYISILRFNNVSKLDTTNIQWVKKDAHESLLSTISNLNLISVNWIKPYLDRYFFLKCVLQSEKGEKDSAIVSSNSIKSRFWKKRINKDSDTRRIFIKDDNVVEVTTGLPFAEF